MDIYNDLKHLSPAQRLFNFVKWLQPAEDRQYAINRHTALRELLIWAPEIHRIFLSGSYSRSTAVAPIHDVDMFVVIKNKFMREDQPFVNVLIGIMQTLLYPDLWIQIDKDNYCIALPQNGPLLVRKQKSSVGVSWGKVWGEEGVTFDLVPAIENSHGSYTIYKRRTGLVHSNPDAAAEKVKYFNAVWNGNFCNFVKLVKKWNKMKEEKGPEEYEKPFKSFHLEVLCYHFAAQYEWRDMRLAVADFFTFLLKNYDKELPVPGVKNQSLQVETNGIWKLKSIEQLVKDMVVFSNTAIVYEKDQYVPEKANACWTIIFGTEY